MTEPEPGRIEIPRSMLTLEGAAVYLADSAQRAGCPLSSDWCGLPIYAEPEDKPVAVQARYEETRAAIRAQEAAEREATPPNPFGEMIDEVLSGPAHKHLRAGSMTFTCHPGCPAYVVPPPDDKHMSSDRGRRRLQRIAGGEFALALYAQDQMNRLQRQVDELTERQQKWRAERDEYLGAVHEIRWSLSTAREALILDLAASEGDSVQTIGHEATGLMEILRTTMLPEEQHDWPREPTNDF